MRRVLLAAVIAAGVAVFPQEGYAAPEPTAFNPNEVNMDVIIRNHEAELKKVKKEYSRDRKIFYAIETEDEYQKALELYHQQRMDEALAVFYNVRDHQADYKLTNLHIQTILEEAARKKEHDALEQKRIRVGRLLLERKKVKLAEDIRVEAGMIEKYSQLYRKIGEAKDDLVSEGINRNIKRVYENLQDMKLKKEGSVKRIDLELCVLENYIRITAKAEAYNREVFRLLREKEYAAANKQFAEFQRAMLVEVKKFNAAVDRKKEGSSVVYGRKGALSRDPGYLAQEKVVFAQGVALFKSGQYGEARTIFIQLASQGNAYAEEYIRKIDRLCRKK
ncbi:MAG: hypothetical protein WCO69_00705 [Candidatus Omnitrophota bacterium]